MKRAIERISLNHALNATSVDPSSKRQHLARLRTNHKVLFIDRALHAAGLIRPLEMTCNHSSFLLQIKILRRGRSVRILAVQSPVAPNIRRLLLRWRLLSQRSSPTHHHQSEDSQNKRIATSLHHILHSHVRGTKNLPQSFHSFTLKYSNHSNKIKSSSIANTIPARPLKGHARP